MKIISTNFCDLNLQLLFLYGKQKYFISAKAQDRGAHVPQSNIGADVVIEWCAFCVSWKRLKTLFLVYWNSLNRLTQFRVNNRVICFDGQWMDSMEIYQHLACNLPIENMENENTDFISRASWIRNRIRFRQIVSENLSLLD